MVERVLKDDNLHTIKDRILNTDCIIIDEVSMLSSRTFGHIEILCRKVRKSDKPFGGIQFVLSGDLYQLKPVPNIAYGDKGQLFIEQDRFSSLVPHKFVLSTVHWQNEGTPKKATYMTKGRPKDID